MEIIQSLQTRIYEIRGQRVMQGFDLAQLYEVETKVLNQAVKRNLKRLRKILSKHLVERKLWTYCGKLRLYLIGK